ncbi:MAG TPA: hypothetical protein VGS41_12520, partial [Chthonomonadales bacterium]|nr:hypothetical protein [Chthonomonadales bacterium]
MESLPSNDSTPLPPQAERDTQKLHPVQAPLSRWLAVALPAVAMSLGWGLRGQFGGPRGAMVPGALIALALVLCSRRKMTAGRVWLAAAAGALGFGIGGEETYMQTVALTSTSGHVLWGYTGLFLKGAEWGGIGGLFLGVALEPELPTLRQALYAFNLALIAALPTYALINRSRFIYFSSGKQEGWAGLTTFYLVLLALAQHAALRRTARLSVYGAVGCGAGFVLGVAAYNLGVRFAPSAALLMDWWKVAESGFGLVGGAVLGRAWFRIDCRAASGGDTDVSQPPAEESCGAMPRVSAGSIVWLTLDLLVVFMVADTLDSLPGFPGRAPFAFVAPALLLAALALEPVALALGTSATMAVTLWNVESYWVNERGLLGDGMGLTLLCIAIAACAAATSVWAADARKLLLCIAWV